MDLSVVEVLPQQGISGVADGISSMSLAEQPANDLPRLLTTPNSGFRGSHKRPNTQGGLRPTLHGPRARLSGRRADRSRSPEKEEAAFHGPVLQQPAIWARPDSRQQQATDGHLNPTAALSMVANNKRTLHEWLRTGSSGREKLTSAASSEVSRPSPSQPKYSWDMAYYSMLRDNISKGPQLGSLMSAMGSSPTEPDAYHRHADQQAMQWLRANYPSVVPSSRQDAAAARQWLDEQLRQLRKVLTPASPSKPSPESPGSSPQPRQQTPSSSGWGAAWPPQLPTEGAVPSTIPGTPDGQPLQASPSPYGGEEQRLPVDVMESLKETLSRSRDAAGFIAVSVISHQEEVFSRCMAELCGQVASSCLDRGYLMHQLWLGLRHLLRAVSGDRDTARSLAVESRQKETACMEGMQSATQQLRSDNEELMRMTDTLHQRLLIRQAEIEVQKAKVAELQSQLGALAGVKPELLRQQISDCNTSLAALQKQNVALNVRLERTVADMAQKDRDFQLMTSKLLEAQEEAAAALTDLQSRTPRPTPPAQPPWDLLSEEQVSMCMRALREGCSPEDLHRLLIGVSATGANLLPYWDLLGCCRYLNPSAPGSLEPDLNNDSDEPGSLEAHLPNVWRNDASTPGPSRWGAPYKHSGSLQPEASLTSMHRHTGQSRPVTRDGRDGRDSLAYTLPANGRRSVQVSKVIARRTLAALSPPPMPIKELHAFLTDLLRKQSVPDLTKYLPEAVVQSVCQMLNHGTDVESTTCLLLGCMSYEGIEVIRYKALAGSLRAVLRQGPADIGGPITEALALACGSTAQRVLQLEKSLLLQRRRALKLSRAAAEQQQRDDERCVAEERRKARKLLRRPHPLLSITSLKRAEFFTGLGMAEDVPAVLRYEGKVYRSSVDVREAVRTVRVFWAAKAEAETFGAPRQLLPDFLHQHMHKKYGKQMVVAEAMYNLLYTAAQNTHDPDLYMFLKAFMGEVEDTLQEDQTRLLDSVLDALTETDVAINQHVAGWLGKSDIRACLQQVLGHKTDAQMNELMDALDSEEPIALVKYALLFEENAEGQQGVFLQVLRSQHVSDRLRFHQAIEDALLDAAERGGVDIIAPPMLAAAIAKAHPKLGAAPVTELMVRVYGPEVTQEEGGGKGKKVASVAPVPWEEAARRLRAVPCDQKQEGEEVVSPVAKTKGKKNGKGRGKK